MRNLSSGSLWVVLSLTSLVGCSSGDDDSPGGTPAPVAACQPTRLFLTTSDYVSGGLGLFEPATDEAVVAPSSALDQDSVPMMLGADHGCAPGVLERGNGVLNLQSVADPFVTERSIPLLPGEAGVPYAANPSAVISVAPDKAYVLLQAKNLIVVVNPTMDGADAITGQIDLSAFAVDEDTDGVVDVTGAVVVGDRVFVALGNYWFDETYAQHFGGSQLVVIDLSSDAIMDMNDNEAGMQAIDLSGDNPWRGLVLNPAGDRLLVGTSGDSFALDGGIELVDIATGTSQGYLLDETTLGAELNGFQMAADGRGYVLAGSDIFSFDPANGAVDVGPAVASGAEGMLVFGTDLYFWSRMGDAPGLRRIDLTTMTETSPASGPWTFGDLPISAVTPVE